MFVSTNLDVINQDDRGIGELVVSTLSNDYMPLLKYRIGDFVETRANASGDGVTYILHGRAPDALKAPDGRRITTRDVDQCFVGATGLVHYRLQETSPWSFVLNTVSEEGDGVTKSAIPAVVEKLEQLIRPTRKIEGVPAKFLLPEPSGKFVLLYPFAP